MTSTDIFTKHRNNILRYAQEYDIEMPNKEATAPALTIHLQSPLNQSDELRVSDIIHKWTSAAQENPLDNDYELEKTPKRYKEMLNTTKNDTDEYFKQIEKAQIELQSNFESELHSIKPPSEIIQTSPEKPNSKYENKSPEMRHSKPPKSDSVERISTEGISRSSLELTLHELDKL